MTKSTAHSEFSEQELNVTPEGALDALANAGDRAPDLVRGWVGAENASAVNEAAERATGEVRKAARRALNVLKSRGITVERRKRVGRISSDTESEVEAFLIPTNAQGVVSLILAAHHKTSRSQVCVVQLRDRVGVLRVENATVSRSSLDEKLREMTKGSGLSPVAVPADWVRGRIQASRARHATNGVPEPLGFDTAKELLSPVPSGPLPHPFDSEGLVIADEDADLLAKESGRLHGLPEFSPWLPPKPAVEEVLLKVGQSFPAGQEPPQDAMTAKITEEVRAAADRYFSPQAIEELVDMMKDGALSVLAREGEKKALEVAATMKVVQRCGLITNPPSDNSFLRGFFEKGIQALAVQNQGQLKIPLSGPVITDPSQEGAPETVPVEEPAQADDAQTP